MPNNRFLLLIMLHTHLLKISVAIRRWQILINLWNRLDRLQLVLIPQLMLRFRSLMLQILRAILKRVHIRVQVLILMRRLEGRASIWTLLDLWDVVILGRLLSDVIIDCVLICWDEVTWKMKVLGLSSVMGFVSSVFACGFDVDFDGSFVWDWGWAWWGDAGLGFGCFDSFVWDSHWSVLVDSTRLSEFDLIV